jgi:hypothetical protein
MCTSDAMTLSSGFEKLNVRSYLSQTEPLPSYVLMPATKQPNIRPQKRNVDLRKGLPKNWRKTLIKITENAKPTYSGLPNGNMTLPFSLQSCGPNGSAADLARSFSAQNTPPPTYLMPAAMSDAPMSMTATPVWKSNIFTALSC